jgi:hypothetical protein
MVKWGTVEHPLIRRRRDRHPAVRLTRNSPDRNCIDLDQRNIRLTTERAISAKAPTIRIRSRTGPPDPRPIDSAPDNSPAREWISMPGDVMTQGSRDAGTLLSHAPVSHDLSAVYGVKPAQVVVS